MFHRNNSFFSRSITSHFIVSIYFLIILCLVCLCSSEVCVHVNDCKCIFTNGSVIDLSSLANKGKPVWENQKATVNPDNYTYSYNPCQKFSIGNDGSCNNVEICQASPTGEHYDLGNQVHPTWNSQNQEVIFIYTSSSDRITNVTLKCSPEAKVPIFEVVGEDAKKSHYLMTLTTRCACADLCSEQHLSGGSVLVILFLIFVSLYLVLGIIHSSLTRGAHGWELIPHHEFWADFPLLVRDGCVFVMSGCKADTAYERI